MLRDLVEANMIPLFALGIVQSRTLSKKTELEIKTNLYTPWGEQPL